MLTIQDVADRLNVSQRTVHKWISQCELEHVRVGRLVRVSESALERFLAAHTKAAR